MKIYAGHIIDGNTICGTERQRIYSEYKTIDSALRYRLGSFIAKNNGYTRVELFANDNVYSVPTKVLYYNNDKIVVSELQAGYTAR